MRDFASSTLWRVSTWHAALDGNATTTAPGEVAGAATTSSLLLSLRHMQAQPHDQDLLALLLVCLRQREAVTLFMEHGPWVWPLSVYPQSQVYYSPRDLSDLSALAGFSRLQLLGVSRPLLKEPSLTLAYDEAVRARFRALPPLLGELAVHGPRGNLLAEIGGRAAYRMTSAAAADLPNFAGALAAAAARLKRETMPLKDIARLPGMSLERACRLLNALYLTGALMVSRSHPAARAEPGA
jgi:hypothetical protein